MSDMQISVVAASSKRVIGSPLLAQAEPAERSSRQPVMVDTVDYSRDARRGERITITIKGHNLERLRLSGLNSIGYETARNRCGTQIVVSLIVNDKAELGSNAFTILDEFDRVIEVCHVRIKLKNPINFEWRSIIGIGAGGNLTADRVIEADSVSDSSTLESGKEKLKNPISEGGRLLLQSGPEFYFLTSRSEVSFYLYPSLTLEGYDNPWRGGVEVRGGIVLGGRVGIFGVLGAGGLFGWREEIYDEVSTEEFDPPAREVGSSFEGSASENSSSSGTPATVEKTTTYRGSTNYSTVIGKAGFDIAVQCGKGFILEVPFVFNNATTDTETSRRFTSFEISPRLTRYGKINIFGQVDLGIIPGQGDVSENEKTGIVLGGVVGVELSLWPRSF